MVWTTNETTKRNDIQMYISERKKIYDTVYEYKDGFGLWCLTPLSTIIHVHIYERYMLFLS